MQAGRTVVHTGRIVCQRRSSLCMHGPAASPGIDTICSVTAYHPDMEVA